MRSKPLVAIDGPAAAGKSTVSRQVAERLNYALLDSGALYRSVALAATRAGIVEDPLKVGELAHELARRGAIRFEKRDSGQAVLLEGEDVTQAIREQSIGAQASKVSAIAEVREALLDMQRAAGSQGGLVAEGRDMGTVVFPDAEAKFFLTASVEERAKRRFAELERAGANAATFDQVCAEVRERDARDAERAASPLRCSEDAEVVDSTDLPIETVVERIVSRVRVEEAKLAMTLKNG